MAGLVKLTEKETVNLKETASFVITQPETVDGEEKEAVRRVTVQDVKEVLFGEQMAAIEAMQLETVEELRTHQRRLQRVEGEKGSAVLTNSQAYPFNDSIKTVALAEERNTLDYEVRIVTVKETGGFAGEIKVTDKQVNGFKVAYTGGAEEVELTYIVTGGY